MVAPAVSTSPLISAAQVEQFHRDGYCVVDALFNADEITAIEAFFEDFKHNGLSVYDQGHKFEEIDPSKNQVRAMHPHRYSERAKAWALHPRVMAVLATLLGRDPLLAQTMYYFKPPGAKGQGMHQDNFYLLAAPATCIAAWTAIDAAHPRQWLPLRGARLESQGHLLPHRRQRGPWLSYGDSHIKPFPRDAKPIPVEVPRGSTMFFGGNLIHGSGPNRTKDRSRRTFIGHYIDEASDQVAKFYHPVLDRQGNAVTRVQAPAEGGGPCGDGWQGATH
jgi:phytanoyl-CoA hydroxylase